MPLISAKFTKEEWMVIADCVREAASQDTVASALASKTLKPLHSRIMQVVTGQRKPVKLGGAALRSHQQKQEREKAPAPVSSSEIIIEANTVAMKVLKEYGTLNRVKGQREAIVSYRKVASCEFGIAKAATDDLIEQLDEHGW